MLSDHRRRSAAFTLFEVVLASAVLVVGFVALIEVVSTGSAVLDVAQKQGVAGQIIHGEIARIHRTSYDQIAVSAGGDPVTITVPADLLAACPSAVAKELVTAESGTLKKVGISVTWVGNTGRHYTRTGSTYAAKNGLYVAYQH